MLILLPLGPGQTRGRRCCQAYCLPRHIGLLLSCPLMACAAQNFLILADKRRNHRTMVSRLLRLASSVEAATAPSEIVAATPRTAGDGISKPPRYYRPIDRSRRFCFDEPPARSKGYGYNLKPKVAVSLTAPGNSLYLKEDYHVECVRA